MKTSVIRYSHGQAIVMLLQGSFIYAGINVIGGCRASKPGSKIVRMQDALL
jgi:hypothetical protein